VAEHTKHAGHFGLHDLTHCAVETALGYHRGFFGLIDDGRDVDDTTGKRLTREQLLEIRSLRGALFRRWSEVEPRKALELDDRSLINWAN
jgi:hypothetical protein